MSHMEDEKKYHRLDPKKKPLYLGAAAVFLLFVLPIFTYLYYNLALDRPAQNDREKVFKIDRGEGVSAISSRLYAENLINSRALFDTYIVISGQQADLQAGVYTITAGYSVRQLVELFSRGTNDLRVTFLEGWRVEEIAQAAEDKFEQIDYEDFVKRAKVDEGRLFPDTYEFNMESDEGTIIEAMKANFVTRTETVLTLEALAKAGLSADQVVTIASIVEREVNTEADRKVVAGILLKRFREDRKLDADATVQYAVAPRGTEDERIWWPKNITGQDLASESPYNTRKVTGLPPTPICNPGLDAIKAVLDPTETDYYYYLTDSAGVTRYAATLEAHNQNIADYLVTP